MCLLMQNDHSAEHEGSVQSCIRRKSWGRIPAIYQCAVSFKAARTAGLSSNLKCWIGTVIY